jgi:hypothetical protein
MMRSFLHVLSALAVIGLAFWAYRENYRTQAALAEAERLQSGIAEARQRLRMLNAEWAYLNRPDRLMDLVEMNYDRLGLMPLQPHQFGRIDQVAYPAPAALVLSNPVDVSNSEEQLP